MEKTDSKIRENSLYLNQDNFNYLSHIYYDRNVYEGDEISNKEKILKYLKSFSPAWITSERVHDIFTKDTVKKVDNNFCDGVYEWWESDIYHFEKYNMPLNDDFIKHVLKQVETQNNQAL